MAKGKAKAAANAKSREEPSDCVEVSKDFYKRATEELSFQIQQGCFTGASEATDARGAPGRREADLNAFAESRRPSALEWLHMFVKQTSHEVVVAAERCGQWLSRWQVAAQLGNVGEPRASRSA